MLHIWQQLTQKLRGHHFVFWTILRELLITEQSKCSSTHVLLYHHFYARQAS